MVRASHQSSEGWGFDPHLVLRNCYPENRASRSFIYHLKKYIDIIMMTVTVLYGPGQINYKIRVLKLNLKKI